MLSFRIIMERKSWEAVTDRRGLPSWTLEQSEAMYILYWIPFRDATKKLSNVVWTTSGPGRHKSFTHMEHLGRGWPRGFGALISSPHSWIFTSVSVGSRSRSYLFTSVTGQIGVHTVPKYGAKPIRFVMLLFRVGAAQLHFVRETASQLSFLRVNRSPIRYDFRSGACITIEISKIRKFSSYPTPLPKKKRLEVIIL